MDVLVQNEGTVVVLYARSEHGRSWMFSHLPKDAPRWCGGVACDWRMAGPIVDDMIIEGLVVSEM